MNPEHWRQVEELYHSALEREPGERARFLAEACFGDEELRREVEVLLQQGAGPTLTQFTGSMRAQLAAGSQLGQYRIEAILGAGGMGVVYRASDSKLGRQVAIKVLPKAFCEDPERLSRFEHEARMLAALDHPNIGAIHGLEEAGGIRYLVLQLVPGETLARRLAAGPLEIGEALRCCAQVAEALESAHEKGIMHRDLKPANINITPEGKVKVLDFGLAKTFHPQSHVDPSQAMTVTADATRTGVVMGTVAYMSPEQARGKPLDKRTDIWSFGCVLYEALTRRKAFHGDTASDSLAAILGREPDWEALPASTPASVTALLRRCLEKDAARRLRDIGDARIELEDALLASRTGTIRAPAAAGAPARRRVALTLAAGLIVGILIAGGAAVFVMRQSSPPPKAVQFSIDLPMGQSIPPTHSSQLALSPDGTLIAYASMRTTEDAPMMPAAKSQDPNPMGKRGAMGGGSGMAAMGQNSATSPAMSQGSAAGMADMSKAASMPPMPMMMSQQLYVRSLDQQEAKPIEGALGDAPFFSPDGKWLGFWHAPTATLRKVALSGGAPVKICDAQSGISGAAWGPDDTIVFAWFDLFRVPAAGGSPKLLLKVDEQKGERFYRHPSFLPGGKALVFTIGMADTDSYDNARIGVVSLETGEKKIVLEGGTSARYSPSGHLIYARGGKLLAAPFDVKKMQVTGPPFPVVDGVFMSSNTGMAAFSISTDGSLVYAAGAMEAGERLPVWVDRKGAATPLPLPPRSYLHPRLSPDERQLAIEVEGASHDIYAYDLSRGVMTKLSFDGSSHWPMWTPKGDRLTFRSWKTGTMTMWWMPSDRSGPPELLTNVGSMQSPESWSPDGKTLALTQMDDPQSGSDIYVLALDGDRKPRPLIRTKFSEGSPKFSPDGKWLAYASNESGRPEIYAMAYPGPGPKIQISTDGGTDPVWRRSGRELYYRNGDMMMMVSITTQPGLTVSKPSVLWKGHYLAGVGSSCGMAGPTSANYDVAASGERFIMIQDKSQDAMCKLLHVARNWSGELNRARSN